MSLTAAEKVRVAHRLDELGVHLIEAGFPSSNPKELELFELLADERFEHADDRRVRDDAPARRRRPPRTTGLRVLADCFAPVVHDRRQDLGAAPREGRARRRARRTSR